ncbi:methyl-accepting chemotaxis protein [Aquabacterium sp.]|uniref:methyl-accepting chemotaxis protein n=1 Tax=Aquabacterium sp. TaxID=1872578 RepID=UPI003D6D5F71
MAAPFLHQIQASPPRHGIACSILVQAEKDLKAFTGHGMYEAIDPIGQVLDQLIEVQLDVARSEYDASQVAYQHTLWTITVLTALALLSGMGLAWYIIRSITGPIGQAVTVAQTVASGDLTSRIDVRSTDETGQLLAALKLMNDGLSTLVSSVRDSSESIATGTAQIATGNADLSQRTEEQASNLQQTAASMEELTGACRDTA